MWNYPLPMHPNPPHPISIKNFPELKTSQTSTFPSPPPQNAHSRLSKKPQKSPPYAKFDSTTLTANQTNNHPNQRPNRSNNSHSSLLTLQIPPPPPPQPPPPPPHSRKNAATRFFPPTKTPYATAPDSHDAHRTTANTITRNHKHPNHEKTKTCPNRPPPPPLLA